MLWAGEVLARTHRVLVVRAEDAGLFGEDDAEQLGRAAPVARLATFDGRGPAFAQEGLGRGGERPVAGEREELGRTGPAFLRLGQPFRLHRDEELPVEVLDGEEFGATRDPVTEQAEQPAGERRVLLTRDDRAPPGRAVRRRARTCRPRRSDRSPRRPDRPSCRWPQAREAAVQDDDLGGGRTAEHGAAQLVVLQRVELRLGPLAVRKRQVQVVPSTTDQPVPSVEDQQQVFRLPGGGLQLPADQADVGFVHERGAVILRHEAVLGVSERRSPGLPRSW